MTKPLNTPDFKSEEEEALWWDQNEDLVLGLFEQAAKDGTLQAKPRKLPFVRINDQAPSCERQFRQS